MGRKVRTATTRIPISSECPDVHGQHPIRRWGIAPASVGSQRNAARSAPPSRARSLALYHSHEREQLLEQGHARMRCARLHAADGPHALGSDAGMQQCGTGLAEVP